MSSKYAFCPDDNDIEVQCCEFCLYWGYDFRKLYKGEKCIDICEQCAEEFEGDTGLKFDSDLIEGDEIIRLLESFRPGDFNFENASIGEKLNYKHPSIVTVEDVRGFLRDIQTYLVFHPDSPIQDYVMLGVAGEKPVFSKDKAVKIQVMVDNCFDICEKAGVDIYQIGMEEMPKREYPKDSDGLPVVAGSEEVWRLTKETATVIRCVLEANLIGSLNSEEQKNKIRNALKEIEK